MEFTVAAAVAHLGSGDIIPSPEATAAKAALDRYDPGKRRWFESRATPGVTLVGLLERKLASKGLAVRIMPEKPLLEGDASRVFACAPSQAWEVRFSVKREDSLLCQALLAKDFDPGRDLGLGAASSQEYRDSVQPVFDWLASQWQSGNKWKDASVSRKSVFLEILEALVREIQSACSSRNPNACEDLARRLLGRHDYYSLAASNDEVCIRSFNFRGDLSHGEKLERPTRLFHCEARKDGTADLVFDEGWPIRLSLKTAGARIEPRLVLNVYTEGWPARQFTYHMRMPTDWSEIPSTMKKMFQLDRYRARLRLQ